LVTACTQFFAPLFPNNPSFSCQPLIPVPVYPSPLAPPAPQTSTAISGLVTGATAAATVIAGSMGCVSEPPATCTTALYNVTTTKAQAGTPGLSPASPNSMLFDPGGDKAYMGSEFGAVTVNPTGFNSNSAFAPISTVTGNVLAVSQKGDMAAFSETTQTPNQVYVTAASGTITTFTALNISAASAAAFSPDELKAFIFGLDSSENPNLYVYSTLQALQTIPLAANTTVNGIAFSNNGAFTYVAESSSSGTANLTAYTTCNNQLANSISLPAAPVVVRVLPSTQIGGMDSQGNPIPNGEHIFLLDPTGIDIVTSNISPPAIGTVCPQSATFSPLQRIELNQGTITPTNFFVSDDGTLIYLVASDRSSVFIYDFAASAWTGGIPLLNNITPVSSVVSLDAGLIMIAGSDGLLHQVTTGLNGFDYIPFQFPNLPDYLNPFCNFTPTAGPCTFNLLVVR
jgi:hypothetical protein